MNTQPNAREVSYLSTHGSLVSAMMQGEALNGWATVTAQYFLDDEHKPVGDFLGTEHFIPISALLPPYVRGSLIERAKAFLLDRRDASAPAVALGVGLFALMLLTLACLPIIPKVMS